MIRDDTQPKPRKAPADGAKDFLLHEYQSLYALHQHAKDVGETRLNFYITFAAALGSVLIATQQFIRSDIHLWLLIAGLAVIMCLGFITFRKMLQRRVATILYRRRLGRVRAWFAFHYPEILPGLPYAIGREIPMDWGKYKLGSSAFSVAFLNTILVIVLVFIILLNSFGLTAVWWSIPASGIVGAATWWFHLVWKDRWLRAAEMQDRQEMADLDTAP
ncbi:MAG TPA: hypothetical protein VFZ66_04275 [Herpetosiphonaceae bacterium]